MKKNIISTPFGIINTPLLKFYSVIFVKRENLKLKIE